MSSGKKKKIKNPYELVNIVEKILHFNNQNQEGQGIRILLPDQILSRYQLLELNYKQQETIQKNLKMR